MSRFIHALKNISLVILSLILAVVFIEGSAKLLLKFNYQKRVDYSPDLHEIWKFEDAERLSGSKDRVGELASVILKWPFRRTALEAKIEQGQFDLFSEPSQEHLSDQGHKLFSGTYELTPNLNDDFRLTGIHSGKMKYRAHYTTDEFGRRRGYLPEESSSNLIFLGCSFTFGQGVNDEETFAYRTGLKSHSLTINMGVPGSSPSVILQSLKLKSRNFLGAVPEKKTTVIYTLIPEHIIRVIGTISYFRSHPLGYKMDPYITENNGVLIHGKNFSDDHTGSKAILNQLARWDFPRAFNIDYPQINGEHFRLVSLILREIEAEIRKQVPQTKKFYVAFFPTGNARKIFHDFRDYLKAEGKIQILDYSSINLNTLLLNSYFLKHDGHPSPLTHDLYADLLMHDIAKDN